MSLGANLRRCDTKLEQTPTHRVCFWYSNEALVRALVEHVDASSHVTRRLVSATDDFAPAFREALFNIESVRNINPSAALEAQIEACRISTAARNHDMDDVCEG